jgi:hypothetical protein
MNGEIQRHNTFSNTTSHIHTHTLNLSKPSLTILHTSLSFLMALPTPFWIGGQLLEGFLNNKDESSQMSHQEEHVQCGHEMVDIGDGDVDKEIENGCDDIMFTCRDWDLGCEA